MAAFPALAQEQTAPPAAPPQSQTQKAATQIEVTASSATSVAGSSVTFTAVVAGTGGRPTGTVTFKDGESVLDSASLSEGRARLTTSALPAGPRAITATYSGDATFEGSVSPVLPHSVAKAATTIALTVSGTASEAGQAVTFTAEVSSPGGTATGTVTFKDGDSTLGEATLSGGRASFSTSALPLGWHSITAFYGGDAKFGTSTSEPQTYRIRQSAAAVPENLPAVLLLLAVLLGGFVILALLALFRRLASRWLLRPLSRWMKALSRVLRRVTRFGRQAPTKERPLKSLLGQSVGGMVFTETEDEIEKDFDKKSVQINREYRLGCSCIQLPASQPRDAARRERDSADFAFSKPKEDIDRDREDIEKARADFDKAKQLFRADVPTDANPLNLYEDIHNAFIVRLLGRSDKACFYVLSEFGRVISANVFCLALVFSSVVTAVAIGNFVLSDLVPFHLLLNGLPTELTFLTIDMSPLLRTVRGFSTGFDKLVFAALSCLLGLVAMLMFYQLAYQQLQKLNGKEMDKFLSKYLMDIQVEFAKINASAKDAIIGKKAEEMRAETVMWITNLQWMAWRVFFIEEFLRNTLFQIRRDSIYSLVLTPLLFIVLFIVPPTTASVLGMLNLDYNQLSFYLLFPILLIWCYRYLAGSLEPATDSQTLTKQWPKFPDLDSVQELNRIMRAYAEQLEQWREKGQFGGATGSGV
jgi:hypothetical protein